MTSSLITEQLRHLPTGPGVYLMRDAGGNILYVGKALNLQHRVRSYFRGGQKLDYKTWRMVERVHDLDFFVTASEQEALILELNLIKRHRPRYNVRLKDDKTFPYLWLDPGEEWPRIYVTRRLKDTGGRYFGPFASARSLRRTVKMLKVIFPFRTCSKPITGTSPRPCLEYHIKRCLGPCIGAVSRREYAGVVKQVVLFLEGKQERVVRELKAAMRRAAQALDFERAAVLRDQVQAVNAVIEGQRIAARVKGEQDVIAFAADKDQACVQVFFIRGGKLVGRENFVLQGTRYEEPPQIMASFVEQFYQSSPYIPSLLLLEHTVEDAAVIEEWLGNKKGSRVRIQVPRRGHKRQLLDIVKENAERGLEQLKVRQLASPRALSQALAEIEKELKLPAAPARMECYDISNIGGTAAVGSMVVFEEGRPKPAHYRRFRIKTVAGADDYAMIEEVIRRRFKRGSESRTSWAVMPDLVLIDGGKGQLGVASRAMREMGMESVPVVGLAKEREEIFLPGRAQPVVLPATSPGRRLLQRLRDEAHRFALGYHQRVRRKQAFGSVLDGIPGIGPGRKRALLKRFGSVRAMQSGLLDDLARVDGMSQALAQKVKEYLGEE
ncbi:excinuclease ABC subunit UvrC [Chloroflexota bacterium]